MRLKKVYGLQAVPPCLAWQSEAKVLADGLFAMAVTRTLPNQVLKAGTQKDFGRQALLSFPQYRQKEPKIETAALCRSQQARYLGFWQAFR